MNREEIARALLQHLAAGTVDLQAVAPLLRKWTAGEALEVSVVALVDALRDETDPEALALAGILKVAARKSAQRAHQMKLAKMAIPDDIAACLGNLPMGARTGWAPRDIKPDPIRIIDTVRAKAPPELSAPLLRLHERIEKRRQDDFQAATDALARMDDALPPGLDEEAALQALRARLAETLSREEREKLVDMACAWPSERAIPVILDAVREPWIQDRATLIMILRFNAPTSAYGNWEAWERRLRDQWANWNVNRNEVNAIAESRPQEPLRAICAAEKEPDPELMAVLAPRPVPLPPPPPPLRPVAPPPPAPRPAAPPPVLRQAPPPEPSLWERHLRSFFIENWYMVAGVLMVIAACSILTYSTWDKHWIIRYTLMPALLGFLTAGLAWMAGWIERRAPEFKGTAATLRGAAVGLLPINFMAVALLADDPQVTAKPIAVPLMGAIYILLFGWGLKRWCSAVHSSLGRLLGGTLLVINTLVAISPLARAVGSIEGRELLNVLGTGFYAGFLVMAAAVIVFTRRILTPEMAKEKRVSWFFGATLVITYLQVFAWVHGYLRHLPQVYTYAPVIVMAGWLVLFVERRALALQNEKQRHGGESFLGFAMILLGVLMGAPQQWIRIVTLILAGAAWLYQAVARRHPAHDWIGLTLLMLGGATVGLLDDFPGPWYPALGLGIALAMGALALGFAKRGWADLARAAAGMQTVALATTTAAAVLTQWHYRSEPLATAACLAAVAAGFAWRAWRDNRLPWVHTAMMALALALPYLGCADVAGRTMRGNTMAFGLAVLSFLWIALIRVRHTPLLLSARSTVLTLYGALATAAMLLRVMAERAAGTPGMDTMDFAGPFLATAALILATWHSRSLIPAALAVTMAVVLQPEAKAYISERAPFIDWGSGLGSAIGAMAMILAAFGLREWPFLRRTGSGDPFMNRPAFPACRNDHTLFTWPLLTGAFFLVLKVDTWMFIQNLDRGMGVKTAAALALTGLAWTLLGVYHREHRGAVTGTHLGWIFILLGIAFGYDEIAAPPKPATMFLILGLALQGMHALYAFVLEPRFAWVKGLLTAPMRGVLAWGSPVIACGCIVALVSGSELPPMGWLLAFTAVQLIWHGLSRRNAVFGTVLFLLTTTVVLAWTSPVRIQNWDMFTLFPILWMIVAIEAAHLAMEFKPAIQARLKPLTVPFHIGAAAMATTLGFICVVCAPGMTENLTRNHQLLLTAGLLLTARAQGSGFLALLGLLLAYILPHNDFTYAIGRPEDRLNLLVVPWKFGTLALILAAIGHAGKLIHQRRPALLEGKFPLFRARWSSSAWLQFAAAGLAVFAALHQTFLKPDQIAASYLAAAAVALVTWSRGWNRLAGYGVTFALLVLGNIHMVRDLFGDELRDRGLSENHLICLGLAATLLEATIFSKAMRREAISIFVNRASLILAAMILATLSATYFASPDLSTMTPHRFAVSGAMAYLAGLYFRRAARTPGPGEEAHTGLCEGFYHFGVTVALWCAALLVPVLRQPDTALAALSLPALYFYARAEMSPRYRASAATMAFLLLGLYLFRAILQMVIFPEAPVRTIHYHLYSPLAIAVGAMMLRLRGLGGTEWLSFYGGASIMTGSFFALTALRGLSPFDYPIPAAWCAVALGHFWTMATTQRSPLRTAIQRMAAITDTDWMSLRRSWGVLLQVACQGAVVWGLSDFAHDTRAVAPLLVGAASIAIHHGVLRQFLPYFVLGAIQIALALHADFFIPSHLDKDHVIWAILGLWALGTAATFIRALPRMGTFGTIMAAATLAHVFYHDPASTVGLWAVAAGAVIAALTPCARANFAAGLLPWIPTWLVFFGQTPLRAWSVLITTATLLATGAAIQLFQPRLAVYPRVRSRLFDHAAAWMGAWGSAIFATVLLIVLPVTATVQLLNYGFVLEARELIMIVLLYAGSATGWFTVGRARRSMLAYGAMELCLLGFLVAIRRQILLTSDVWWYAYDVWIAMSAALCLAGTKSLWDRQPREIRIPLLATLLALPAASLLWTVWRGLGTDTALLVIGLYSMMFTYLGKDDRESPYHLASVAGFVAFLLLLFWSRLSLRVAYAYVVPVGLGVLTLLQLFGKRMEPGTRNGVRLVTLLAMLGSAGYYALIDDRYPVAFNLSMIVLCLLAMGLGGFLRVRMYAALGFAGLMVDLASILTKVLGHMDRNARMTAIGSIVLVVGAALVFGAIHYKVNRDAWAARLARWRLKIAPWE